MIQSPEAGKPNMILYMCFNDAWEGVKTLADATEEDMEAVKQDFYEVLEFDDGDLTFEDAKTGEGTPVLIVKSVDGDFGAAYAVYRSPGFARASFSKEKRPAVSRPPG